MKEYHLGLDITKELKEKMQTEAQKLGMTLATYVRQLLIKIHN